MLPASLQTMSHIGGIRTPNKVFNLTYLGGAVLAFGNKRATQNAG